MKKRWLITAALLMAIAISGCSNEADVSEVPETSETTEMAEIAETVDTAEIAETPEEINIGESEENMLLVMDALNMCMIENAYTYDANDPQFFWTAMGYTVGNSPELYENGSDGMITYNEEGYYKVHSTLVQEYAAAVFAGVSELPELPEINLVTKNEEENYYNFHVGDRGISYGNLSSWVDNGDGTYTAEVQLVSGEDDSIIGAYEYTLVENSYTASVGEPVFEYAISGVAAK